MVGFWINSEVETKKSMLTIWMNCRQKNKGYLPRENLDKNNDTIYWMGKVQSRLIYTRSPTVDLLNWTWLSYFRQNM